MCSEGIKYRTDLEARELSLVKFWVVNMWPLSEALALV